MSIYLKQDVFVVIRQMNGENAPRPLPLSSGFSEGLTYEVLGIHSASESGEAFLILRNDRDEMWFISNRHVRIVDVPVLANSNGGMKMPHQTSSNGILK